MEFTGREARRFLGFRGEPGPEDRARIAEAGERVRAVAEPRYVARLVDVAADGDILDFAGVFRLRSGPLSVNLRGCPRAFLFAATLGPGPDRLVRRLEATGAITEAAWAQAAAAEMVDAWCDDVTATLARDPAVAGCKLRPRFSPGYGDVPLSLQRPFLAALDATRRIGVTLTAAFLMVPTKSVSAFVGVSPPPPNSPTSQLPNFPTNQLAN